MPLESALPAGADPRRRAVALARSWEAMQAGRRLPAAVRPVIAESWKRVHGRVDPDHGRDVALLSRDEVAFRRLTSLTADVVAVVREGLVSILDDAGQLLVIADADGRVLWCEGPPPARSQAAQVGFVEGASCDEDTLGTGGIGTSLVVDRPVQVFAAEHYVRACHPWVCTAAPMHDPIDGRLIGVVGIAGPALTVQSSMLALVALVTRLAHEALRQRHHATLESLRGVAGPVLAQIAGRALVTDRNGWVAATTGLAPIDRVFLPVSPGGGDILISPLGWCRVEPLFDGWLVQVGSDDTDPPTAVRLDLRGPRPSIVVLTPTGSWSCELSQRHAEILALLALHPVGRSARELSSDMFGVPDHAVTVRAEMCRLRRRLGSLIEARPYRFALGLEVVTRVDVPSVGSGRR